MFDGESQINGERVRSKGRAQELFRTVRGDVSLLVVRPTPALDGHDDDLDNLLDLSQSLSQTQVSRQSLILNVTSDIGF